MKFGIQTLAVVVLIAALSCAWINERAENVLLNQESSFIAAELYRQHMLQDLDQTKNPHGSFLPPSWNDVLAGKGDLIDLTTINGRKELIDRLTRNEKQFRVKMANGKILSVNDFYHSLAAQKDHN